MSAPNGSAVNGHANTEIPSHFIGGNHLEAASPSTVKDFVAQHGGHSVISSVSTHLLHAGVGGSFDGYLERGKLITISSTRS